MMNTGTMFLLLVGVFTANVALISGNKCPPPLQINHGQFEFISSPKWPKEICRVRYSCDLGFKLTGGEIIYCFHSRWIGDVPVCKEINCEPLEAPANGSMSEISTSAPTYGMDSIMEFRCNKGYELIGDVSLVCLASGDWSNDTPHCAPEGCEDETAPATTITTEIITETTTAAVTTTADIDECLDSSLNNCNENAVCTNTDGSFTCECKIGFSGDGVNCQEWSLSDWSLSMIAEHYKLIDETMTWQEGKAYCESFGGQLAVDGMKDLPVRQKIARALNVNYRAWIGLTDLDEEGRWMWIDGTSADTNAHWYRGQPDNYEGNEHCGRIWPAAYDYKVNDSQCDSKFVVLCQLK